MEERNYGKLTLIILGLIGVFILLVLPLNNMEILTFGSPFPWVKCNDKSTLMLIMLGLSLVVALALIDYCRMALIATHDFVLTKTFNLLLNRGSDVNVRTNNDGWTALMTMSFCGYAKTVNLFLDRGADVNVRTNEGRTALMFASYKGHVEIVNLLLERGADVNVRTNDGWTALMVASQEGHTKIARLLLRHGAVG